MPAAESGSRLTLVGPSLAAGGAERVLALLANAWAARGHAVTVVTLASADGDFHALDPRVRRVALGRTQSSRQPLAAIVNNLRRVAALRAALAASRPERVIGFVDETNVLCLLASRGLGVPVIVCEHTDPRQHPLGRPWALLRRLVYPLAYRVVMLTDATLAWARAQWPRWRAMAIPNPVVMPPPRPRGRRRSGPHTLLTLGRLHPVKGHALLIRAFARIAARHPDWRLVIHGEGPERARLERLIERAGLAGRVALPGNTPDAAGALAAADLFVLSSRYEGFPMALLEAMASGLAVISVDCPSGPAAIIHHEEDGLLTPPDDPVALAEALDQLMGEAAARDRLGRRALAVRERYGLDTVLALWAPLLPPTAP